MILIRAETKRGQLRQILLVNAVASVTPVAQALLLFQSAVNEQNFRVGRQYASVSGSGQHSSFLMVGSGSSWTQENVFGMSEEFFGILEDTLEANPSLIDDGQPASTQAIFSAMLKDDRLRTVTRRGLDTTLLGWPQIGQVAGPV